MIAIISKSISHHVCTILLMQIVAALLLQEKFSIVQCLAEENATQTAATSTDHNVIVVQLPETTEVSLNEISQQAQLEPRAGPCGAAEADLDRYSAQLIGFGQNKAIYPTSMEELDSLYCPSFMKTIDCIKNSTECFKPFERQIINWVLTSTRRMNHKRCKNDQEKEKFLKMTHACFRPIRDSMDKCMTKYIANLEAIANLGPSSSGNGDDLQIQLSCCANLKFKQCAMNSAKQQCKPLDIMKKLNRTNSTTSQRTAHRSVKKAMSDMMEEVKKTLDGMALTGPEFICRMVDDQFCRTNFEGKLNVRETRHRSIVPAMLKIYSNNKQE